MSVVRVYNKGLLFGLGFLVLACLVGMGLIASDAYEQGFDSGVEWVTGNDYDVGCMSSCVVECVLDGTRLAQGSKINFTLV